MALVVRVRTNDRSVREGGGSDTNQYGWAPGILSVS